LVQLTEKRIKDRLGDIGKGGVIGRVPIKVTRGPDYPKKKIPIPLKKEGGERTGTEHWCEQSPLEKNASVRGFVVFGENILQRFLTDPLEKDRKRWECKSRKMTFLSEKTWAPVEEKERRLNKSKKENSKDGGGEIYSPAEREQRVSSQGEEENKSKLGGTLQRAGGR